MTVPVPSTSSDPAAPLIVSLMVTGSDGLATRVTMREAARKPSTNFGKRRQISPASMRRSIPVFSQRVVATIARTTAQMPIQTSRPTTFMSVKAKTD